MWRVPRFGYDRLRTALWMGRQVASEHWGRSPKGNITWSRRKTVSSRHWTIIFSRRGFNSVFMCVLGLYMPSIFIRTYLILIKQSAWRCGGWTNDNCAELRREGQFLWVLFRSHAFHSHNNTQQCDAPSRPARQEWFNSRHMGCCTSGLPSHWIRRIFFACSRNRLFPYVWNNS